MDDEESWRDSAGGYPVESASSVPRLVYLLDPAAGHGRWFGVSERQWHPTGEVGAYTLSGTVTLKAAVDWVRREIDPSNNRPPSPWAMVIWARNKTQVKDWLITQGHNVHFGGVLIRANRKEQGMTRLGGQADSFDELIASAQATLDRARARLERLLAMPREPQPDADGRCPVIRFRKRFSSGGVAYDYAAIRSSNGRWNTTGPKSPKDYSWVELLQWILDGADEDGVEVELATGWGDIPNADA